MVPLKGLAIILLVIVFTGESSQIQIGENAANLAQKRKVYCVMISYHFLDNDMEAFSKYTEGFGEFKIYVFRNRVANKLSQNCQQKITNQQIIQLSKLVQKPDGRQKQIQSIQHKYIQYFAPEEKTVLKLLEQVKIQSDVQIRRQIQKIHKAREQIQQSTKAFSAGFKGLEDHIKQTNSHMLDGLEKFFSSFKEIHAGIAKNVEEFKNNPQVKRIKQIWDEL